MQQSQKHVPMLFSTPMVQAILNGIKTETRRIVKEKPDFFVNCVGGFPLPIKITNGAGFYGIIKDGKEQMVKPKANVGDIIWVRETFQINYPFSNFVYKADGVSNILNKWKPSLFMTKEACRLFLKCVSVHAERLQDIDEQSAINEGAIHGRYLGIGQVGGSFREGYFELWDQINGNGNTLLNPFVWVYKFEITERPIDFLAVPYKVLKPIQAKGSSCPCCQSTESHLDLETVLYNGFGGWMITKNGERFYQSESLDDDNVKNLQEIENIAKLEPYNNWMAILFTPLRGAEYQRQNDKWVLVELNEGFA